MKQEELKEIINEWQNYLNTNYYHSDSINVKELLLEQYACSVLLQKSKYENQCIADAVQMINNCIQSGEANMTELKIIRNTLLNTRPQANEVSEVCQNCGKLLADHSKASKMCPDRFKHFESQQKQQANEVSECHWWLHNTQVEADGRCHWCNSSKPIEPVNPSMPTDEEIQNHMIMNCRNDHGEPMMDEQTFYEGAKWLRGQVGESDWISVEDRLPDKQGYYLVHCPQSFPKNYRGQVAEFYEDNQTFYSEYGDYPIEDAKHWNPLPTTPETKDKK